MPPTRSPTAPLPRPRAAIAASPSAPALTDLVLFVSSVEGKPVSRLPLPTSRGGSRSLIGARREGGKYLYDVEEIVGLTRAEAEAHGKVYRRLIAEDELRARTRADWEAWQRALREREKMAAGEAKAEPAPPAGGTGS